MSRYIIYAYGEPSKKLSFLVSLQVYNIHNTYILYTYVLKQEMPETDNFGDKILGCEGKISKRTFDSVRNK